MFSGKGQNQQKPTAMGSMTQASCYGMTIPNIMGLIKSPVYPIEAWNLRQGNSSKKGKKKGIQTYVENTDMLLGMNPIVGYRAIWANNIPKVGNYYGSETHTISAGQPSVTISDPLFKGVVCATLTIYLSGSFDDYGGPGTVPYAGDSDIPLWNMAQIGPDPSWPNGQQLWPYVYKWVPSDGNTIYLPSNEGGQYPSPILGSINIYYAADTAGHLEYFRLTFEDQLGNGPEFDGTQPFRIIYPMYAGLGSADIDLGATGVLPAMKAEVQGKYCMMPPYGDAEYVDMIQDVMKSGLQQAAYSFSSAYSGLQLGVNCYDNPGITEVHYHSSVDPIANSFTFRQNIAAGTKLLVVVSASTGTATPSISDGSINTWHLRATGLNPNGDLAYAIWETTSIALPSGYTVTASVKPYYAQISGFMLFGVDTFDSVAVFTSTGYSSPNLASIVTTNPGGQVGYVFAFIQSSTGEPTYGDADVTGWKPVLPGEPVSYWSTVLASSVTQPTTVQLRGTSAGGNWVVVLVAFKQVNPSGVAAALGNIMDESTLQVVRSQGRANGLFGSLTMASQKSASDWLKDLYQCANAAPVWSGFRLKSIAWSEVSKVAFGTVYTSPTSTGPVASFDAANGDFVSSPPLSIERTAQSDVPNVFQMQIFDRGNDYNQVVISQPLAAATSIYGPRKDSPQTMEMVTSPSVGRMLLMIKARVATLDRNVIKGTLNAKFGLYEAMDLVLLTDEDAGIFSLPARITSWEEDEKYNIAFEASPFIYGEHAPDDNLNASSPIQTPPPLDEPPGFVNTPIIFQPVSRLLGNQNQPEVWFVISGSSQYYGGCLVFVSTDGGSSYNPLGEIRGNAVTGYTTADWPAAADPDTADPLAVDLTESNGTMQSYSLLDENNFVYPFYVSGGGSTIIVEDSSTQIALVGRFANSGVAITGPVSAIADSGVVIAGVGYGPTIPYELGAYSSVAMTSSFKYTIAAGGGYYIRRAVFGAPILGEGVDHPTGSRFCMLNPLGIGMLKVLLDPIWVLQTLYFKFCAYNTFGGELQSLGDVVAYPYTPITQGLSPDYVQAPALALSQAVSTFVVAMVQVSEAFPGNPANYNARTFTVPDPGGTPTYYYVTILDPGQLGDTDGGTTCPSFCETSTERAGIPGYTYIGAILVTHAGGATTVLPGGWPQTL